MLEFPRPSAVEKRFLCLSARTRQRSKRPAPFSIGVYYGRKLSTFLAQNQEQLRASDEHCRAGLRFGGTGMGMASQAATDRRRRRTDVSGWRDADWKTLGRKDGIVTIR